MNSTRPTHGSLTRSVDLEEMINQAKMGRPMLDYAERIKALVEQKLSLSFIAEQTGVSERALYKIRKGVTKIPTKEFRDNLTNLEEVAKKAIEKRLESTQSSEMKSDITIKLDFAAEEERKKCAKFYMSILEDVFPYLNLKGQKAMMKKLDEVVTLQNDTPQKYLKDIVASS